MELSSFIGEINRTQSKSPGLLTMLMEGQTEGKKLCR